MKAEADVLRSDRVVVFADMLGFAALTEAHPLDLRALNARSRPLAMTLEELAGGCANPLTEAFSNFHSALKWAIEMAEDTHPLTAITFSDSAFIATTYLFEAANFAIRLTQSALSRRVPVRMGIAFGSFATLRFRSDISLDGGDHAAQFLGTAVVRAYHAEKCGIKGIRALLHPSLEPLFADDAHNPAPPPFNGRPFRPIECSPAECANGIHLKYELNYWDMAVMKQRDAWRGLQDMWAVAPDYARDHYQATAEAINRMRIAQKEAPLTNLRRRTLPRPRG